MHLDREILRFTTAGSVDDGKSTLIGRLLYDSKSIFEDQYEAISATSARRGAKEVDLALLTDGLRAEREQGITIDVAYRYFATPARKFIVADTPGHIEFTRNMVTGASTAHAALILADASRGIAEQTRRHTCIASLLGIRHVIFCVNKMDLVGYREEAFEKIKSEILAFTANRENLAPKFVPLSALLGDNVVDRSSNMPWHDGLALLELLETLDIAESVDEGRVRFPVQSVVRDAGGVRRYLGRVAGGVVTPGQAIVALPGGASSTIAAVETMAGPKERALPGESVALTLSDDISVGRGDLISAGEPPSVESVFEADLCWLGEAPMRIGGVYGLRCAARDVRAIVKSVEHRIDIATLARMENDGEPVGRNALVRVSLQSSAPLAFDAYSKNRTTGSFILIDEGTYVTVGAGMIV